MHHWLSLENTAGVPFCPLTPISLNLSLTRTLTFFTLSHTLLKPTHIATPSAFEKRPLVPSPSPSLLLESCMEPKAGLSKDIFISFISHDIRLIFTSVSKAALFPIAVLFGEELVRTDEVSLLTPSSSSLSPTSSLSPPSSSSSLPLSAPFSSLSLSSQPPPYTDYKPAGKKREYTHAISVCQE